jgi:hypothetical protein
MEEPVALIKAQTVPPFRSPPPFVAPYSRALLRIRLEGPPGLLEVKL